MKKQIFAIAAISAVFGLTGCGADITVTTMLQNAAVSLSATAAAQTVTASVQTAACVSEAAGMPAGTQTVHAEGPQILEIPLARSCRWNPTDKKTDRHENRSVLSAERGITAQ